MARIKYYYDTEKCKYERVKVKPGDVILQFVVFVLLAGLIGVGGVITYLQFNPTPKELAQQRQLEDMREKLHDYGSEVNSLENSIAELEERDRTIYRVVTGAEDLPEQIRKAGSGGALKYRTLLEQGTEIDSILHLKFNQIAEIQHKIKIQQKSYDEIYQLAIDKEKMWASVPAIQPIKNKELNRIASGFGWRIHPIYKVRKMHTGMDFSAKIGTPIYATGDGVIIKAKKSYGGYGNEIEIDHGYGYVTKYAHMKAFKVKKGQKIKRGEQIGTVGNTGASTGPHLHYEVIMNGKKVNPVHYFFNDLNEEEYEKVLKLASIENQSMS
jgi:murein DD-endopeptidase MepM/ murein hydrolase activator NlpD